MKVASSISCICNRLITHHCQYWNHYQDHRFDLTQFAVVAVVMCCLDGCIDLKGGFAASMYSEFDSNVGVAGILGQTCVGRCLKSRSYLTGALKKELKAINC